MEDSATLARHIPALDGVRAVAVSAVLALHLSYGFFQGGFLGVDFFFVLSGYLITGLLLKEFAESGGIRLDLFYRRRLYRILPPIVVVLVLTSALRPWISSQISSPWTESYWTSMAAVLFFFANFISEELGPLGPTWSLSIEEQFYLVWPALLIAVLTRRRSVLPVVICLMIGLSMFSRAYLEYRGVDARILYSFTPFRIDSLLAGALAALASNSPATIRLTKRLSGFRVPEVILMIFFGAVIFVGRNNPALYYGGFTVVALLFALFLLCVVHERRERAYLALLQSALATWLGKRSYGLYLYHLPIFFVLEMFRVQHSMTNLVLISLLRIGLAVGFAELSYRYVETPFLRRKALLRWKREG